jgi:cbb3-type cytochrome oxidase subunit 3
VSNLQNYFSTDWSAMTGHDWAGLIVTIVIFFGLAYAFWWALRPSKKKELEEQKFKVLDED